MVSYPAVLCCTNTMAKVDTTATSGLRGLAALHIMVRSRITPPEYNNNSPWFLDISLRRHAHIRGRGPQWSSRSPDFLPSVWILSDFEIRQVTLSYRAIYCVNYSHLPHSPELTNERSWSSVQFLKTRLSRILPLYYIANIIGYFGRYIYYIAH